MISQGIAKTISLVALAAIVAVLGLGGCGSSSDAPQDGTLHGVTVTFPDYLDPALSLSIEGVSAMWNTYLPLLTYVHADGAAGTKLIPGLARALPRIGDGGRTYTLFLRQGLRYSDGTPVRASDFSHEIERVLALSSGGSGFFDDIVGAERFQETKHGGIAGIRTDDGSGRITIHLREPSGTFTYELATLFAAPVPGDTPDEDMTADPPPATGPYEIVSTRPGRSWEYRRNPEWAAHNAKLLPQLPSGHYDRIEIDVVTNPQTEVNDVEKGKADWMVNPPPSERIGSLRQDFDEQLVVTPQISVFYFWMNTSAPPFDDVRVRRAVNYAIDPRALARIYAGQVAPMQQILPPAMPGHVAYTPFPHDLAKAKELMAAADPKDRQIDVWTNSYPANLEAGEYYEGVLRELGFEPKLKTLDPANYFTVIGNLSTPDLDTGWGNWLLDYPHPNDYFEPQLTKDGIQQTNNTNWAQFDDPALSAEVARLRREPLGPAQKRAYARLDREYMRQAPWAPFGTIAFNTFVSSAIEADDVVVSPIYGQDLASFQPK
ncbi:MAG TPA: ABC transporter substrate-binding protein [Solirubrobacterales bacterium]